MGMDFSSINNLQAEFSLKASTLENQVKQIKDEFAHPSDKQHEKLKKAAQDFEAVFMKQLLDEMDKTVDKSGFLDGGHAEEMFRGMLNQEVSTMMAKRPGGSGFGFAENIYKQLSRELKSVQQPESQPQNTIQKEG